MPDHHVKGQPAAPTYAQKRGVLLFTLIVQHPVELQWRAKDCGTHRRPSEIALFASHLAPCKSIIALWPLWRKGPMADYKTSYAWRAVHSWRKRLLCFIHWPIYRWIRKAMRHSTLPWAIMAYKRLRNTSMANRKLLCPLAISRHVSR